MANRPVELRKEKVSILLMLLITAVIGMMLVLLSTVINDAAYVLRGTTYLRLADTGFVEIDAKGNVIGSRAASMTLLDGREITVTSFGEADDELVIQLFEKCWSWLPLPRYRSQTWSRSPRSL